MYTIASFLKSIYFTAAVDKEKYPWYRNQGVNLSECGPTAALMAYIWATGKETSRKEVRKFNTDRSWWVVWTISDYLKSVGVFSKVVNTSTTYLAPGELGIYHVYGNHFVVIVPQEDGSLVMADPYKSRGVKTITRDHLESIISHPLALKVTKS